MQGVNKSTPEFTRKRAPTFVSGTALVLWEPSRGGQSFALWADHTRPQAPHSQPPQWVLVAGHEAVGQASSCPSPCL